MVIIFTSDSQCPKCGHKEFTSPANPTEHAPITCLSCRNVTTVNHAIDTFKAAQINPERFHNSR